MRIAWISPLSLERPLKSAAFSREVLKAAQGQWSVEVFSDGLDLVGIARECRETFASGEPVFWHGYPVYSATELGQRHQQNPYDLFIYQHEGADEGRFVERYAALWPGINFLHHFDSGKTDRVEVFVTSRSEFSPASAIWHLEQVNFPLHELKESFVLTGREHLREALSIPQDRFVVGFSGYQEMLHRIEATLLAFASLANSEVQQSKPAHLLWIVPDDEREAQAAYDVKCLEETHPEVAGLTSVVKADSLEALFSLLSTIDALVSFRLERKPAAPLSVLAAMARGVPSIVPATVPYTDLPQDSVIMVPELDSDGHTLYRVLKELAESPIRAKQIGACGREFIAKECDPEGICEKLNSIFVNYKAVVGEMMLRQAENIDLLEQQILRTVPSGRIENE